MSMSRKAVFIVLVALLSLPLLAAGPLAKPGKWETTMTMEMPGMPAKMQPVVTTHCVTPEDAAEPKRMIPSSGRDQDCKITDYKLDGNKVTWSVKCEGKHPGTGSGEAVYNGDSYESTMKMDMGGQKMSMKMKGKRIGECDK